MAEDLEAGPLLAPLVVILEGAYSASAPVSTSFRISMNNFVYNLVVDLISDCRPYIPHIDFKSQGIGVLR
jgi:hypothetical protein